MAKIDVKRDITVTMVLTEKEAEALQTVLQYVAGDKREILAICRELMNSGIGYTNITGLTGSIKWEEEVPF